MLQVSLCAAFCVAGADALAQTAPAPDAAQAQSMNSNQAAPRFDIMEYVVDGNTVLSVPDIEEAVYSYLGEMRTAADVDMARETLERAYQMRGFQTVQVVIPEQGVETGIIHLQVIENPVGRLRVVGSKFHSLADIREKAPS